MGCWRDDTVEMMVMERARRPMAVALRDIDAELAPQNEAVWSSHVPGLSED